MGATGFRAVGALGKGASANNFFGRMAKGEGSVADFMANAFIENHGLKAKYADVIAMKEKNFADANDIGYQFLDIAERMKKLSEGESQLLYKFLDGREGVGKTDLVPDLLTMGEDARKAIIDAGQRLVDVGALDKETWLKNINSYIHRSYVKNLAEKQRFQSIRNIWANDNVRLMADELRMRGKTKELVGPKKSEDREAWMQEMKKDGWEHLGKKEGKELFRRDYTPEERAEMGEIENAAFAMIETGKLMHNDIAALGLYNDVFKAHARLDSKTLEKLSIRAEKLMKEKRLPDEEAMNAWIKERTPEQALALSAEEAAQLGLKQVPGTIKRGTKVPLFGKLANSYIPKEIYDDLIAFKNTVNHFSGDDAYGSTARKLFMTYRMGNQLWKRTKTSWNPTVHTNNVMSNLILMDLLNVPYKYLNVGRHVFTKKGRELLDSKYDNLYKDLTRFGVLDAGLASKELGFASKKWSDEVYQDSILNRAVNSPEQVVEGSARIANKMYKHVRNPLNPFKWADREVTKFYQTEDQMFRIALYKHRLDEGMKKITSVKGTPEFDRELELLKRSAAKQAKRGFIDYDIQAPGIQFLRETSSPFISYTYRVIPLLAETATLRPMKFAKWAAVGYGLNFVGRELSESNEEAERGMMSSQALQHMFGVPFMPYSTIKMPDRIGKLFTMGFDEDPVTGKEFPDRSMYLNTSRWIPGGDVLGLTGQAGAEGMRIPGLPAPLQPSFGLMGDIFFSLVMGQDAFTGKKITSVKEGEASALLARSKHLLRKLLPNNPLIGDFGLFPDEQSFRSYSQRKIIRALNSEEAKGNLPGRYELPVLQAVAQTIGIKLHPFEPRVEEQLRSFEYKNKVSRFKSEARRIQRQVYSGVMSSEDGANAIDELQQELEEVLFRYRKMRKSSSKAKGYKEGGVIDLDTPEEKEFDTDVHKDLWKEKFSEDIKRIEREEEEARPRIRDIHELTELEKAVDIDKEGITEPARYMQDYGTRRRYRLSDQISTTEDLYPADPADPSSTAGKLFYTEKKPGVAGAFFPDRKGIYTAPYLLQPSTGKLQIPIEKTSAISTEQHEGLHAFLDALRVASLDEEVLNTLPEKEQKRLLLFMDFLQDKAVGGYAPDHEVMNLPEGRTLTPEYGYVSDPLYVTPDQPEGLGRLETINKIAKAFNIAAAKNPEIHGDFIRRWEESGFVPLKRTDSYKNKLEELMKKRKEGFIETTQEEEFPGEEQGRASGGFINRERIN